MDDTYYIIHFQVPQLQLHSSRAYTHTHTLSPIAFSSWSSLTPISKVRTLMVAFLDTVSSTITRPSSPGSLRTMLTAGGLLQGNTVAFAGNLTPVPNTSTWHSSPSQASLVMHVTLLAAFPVTSIECRAPHVVIGHADLSIGILVYGNIMLSGPPFDSRTGLCSSTYIGIKYRIMQYEQDSNHE